MLGFWSLRESVMWKSPLLGGSKCMSASLKAYKGMTSFLLELMFNYGINVENYVHYPFQVLVITTKSNVSHSRGEHYTACVKGCLGI